MDTKQLKQKILDLAIRGKLVPQDPNDEPASVLLERIRKEKEQLIAAGKLKKSKTKTTDTPHYENVPFEIPDSWEWQTLGDIGKWQAGGTPSRGNKEYYGGEIPWLKTGDLNDGYITNIPESITLKGLNNSSAKLNPKDSILVALYGATIGRTGILTFPATTNQACCACIEYLAVDKLFLFYFLRSHRDIFISQGGGGAQPNISKEIIIATPIPIPPLTEQKRIVAEIEKWFALIDDIETHKSDLQDYIRQAKSKVLDLAIHGKLVPQDPNEEPAIELLKRINPHFIPCDTSHYENLPETWCVALMGEVYNHTTGKALKKADLSGELRQYITTSNVYWNSFDFTEVRSMYFTEKELDKCTAHKGDLLVCNGGDVGRAAIWDYDYDICYQNHISRLRPKSADIVFNPFYNYLFRYLKDKGQLNGKGVAITSLSAADIQSLAIPLPPLVEQKRIVERIETIFAQLDTITAEL